MPFDEMKPSVPLSAPRHTAELFWAFTSLAMQGFGGVLPVTQRELVERRHWVSREQFLELLSVAQVLPGPNVINLALMLGDRWFGWRGAIAAMSGMMLAPLLVVLLLAWAVQHGQDLPAVRGALRGMGVVAAGLVLSTVVRLWGGLRRNALGLPLCVLLAAATLLFVGVLHWPLVGVVLGLGALGMALAAWRLRQRRQGPLP